MPRLPRRVVQHPCELRCFVHAHPLAARAHRSGRACKAREGALHLLHATRSRPTRALRRWSRRICACHGRSVWLLWTVIKLQKKTPKRKLDSRWPLVTTHSRHSVASRVVSRVRLGHCTLKSHGWEHAHINSWDRVRTRISLSCQSHLEKRYARRARAPTSTEDSSTVPQKFLSTAPQACLGIRRQEVEHRSSRDQRADCRARRSHPR